MICKTVNIKKNMPLVSQAMTQLGNEIWLAKYALRFQSLDVGEDIFYLLVGDVRDIDGLALFFGFEVVGGGFIALVQRTAAHVVNVVFFPIAENVYHNL